MISDAKLESYSNYDCKVALTRLPLELTRTICKMVKSPKEELKCQICEAKFKTNQHMKLHLFMKKENPIYVNVVKEAFL
jgi:hypothetical protein